MIDPESIDLTDFLATWYGVPSGDTTSLPTSCDWLPEPLRQWHLLAARWDRPLTFTSSMIAPERIRVADDGKAIFMVDATGDWRWCVDPGEPDAVFDAERYEPWERSTERLAELLVHNTVREVVYGAVTGMRALAVSGETVAEILATMAEVAFGAWRWPAPGYRTFLGGATLAQIIETDAGWDVEVVAPEPGRLTHIEAVPGARWRKRVAPGHSG